MKKMRRYPGAVEVLSRVTGTSLKRARNIDIEASALKESGKHRKTARFSKWRLKVVSFSSYKIIINNSFKYIIGRFQLVQSFKPQLV